MRSYVNIFMGKPFKDEGSRPKLERVIELRGGYKSGTVPKDVLYLTMAVDVQRGSEKDEKNPPRLELEVLGHGMGYRTWSILYKSILGETDDPFSGAWEELDKWIEETDILTFTRIDGERLKVKIVGIDSGDQSDTVYRFCEKWINTYPIKGFSNIKADPKKKEKGDLSGNIRRYKAVKFDYSDNYILQVNTNHYKRWLYSSLNIPRQPAEPQKPGFCSFPRDYPDEYFDMLTGEERRIDNSFHQIRSRVEALDVRVYNLAIAGFFLDSQVTGWRTFYQNEGASPLKVQSIDSKWVLERLQNNPSITYPKNKKSRP
jgi:phage terminase large subunit GpA-like protein